MRLLCGYYAVACFITFSVLFSFFSPILCKIENISKVQKKNCWHVQFIENIFLLQCLEKEIATAKELDLRPLGKVIIFRDKLTGGSNRPFRCLDYPHNLQPVVAEQLVKGRGQTDVQRLDGVQQGGDEGG